MENRSKKNRTQIGFDFLAPFYDQLVFIFFGNTVSRSRKMLLPELPPLSHALMVGEGTGKFLKEILEAGKVEKFDCLDVSEEMLVRAKRRISVNSSWLNRVRFIHGSVEEFRAERKYDLIVTSYFLDLFDTDELRKIISRLDSFLANGGTWYISDFSFGRAGGFIFDLIYLFFRRVCGISANSVPDYEKEFARMGYSLERNKTGRSGLTFCSIYRKDAIQKKSRERI